MRRVFKTRAFIRTMRKSGLTDGVLCAAVQEMIRGLVDADLGGGVLKKRIALAGRGKRGSTALCSPATAVIGGSSCLDTRRTHAPTSRPQNGMRCNCWPLIYLE